MAWREVSTFRGEHPEAAVYVVHVVEQRALSNAIAARTGVRHESPQAILLEAGRVSWNASHDGITADALAALVPAAARQ